MHRRLIAFPSSLALYVLPYVSVASEKTEYLSSIGELAGLRVVGCMGSNGTAAIREFNIAVCTIEKANSVLNRLLEERATGQLSTVIVDELHMVGSGSRGCVLELLLTKLRQCFRSARIVGMSATLPNMEVLCRWLDADYFRTQFRPVPLREYAVIGRHVLDANMAPVRELEGAEDVVPLLCAEAVKEGCGVLVFLPRKRWCENLAARLASSLALGPSAQLAAAAGLAGQMQAVGSVAGLLTMVRAGVAYHHAGLTTEERALVESGFRTGALLVLCCTSTLSSGVNLPARRVIVGSVKGAQSHIPLDTLDYKQMAGRAGRFQQDTRGEAFLICSEAERGLAQQLLAGVCTAAHSALLSGGLISKPAAPRVPSSPSRSKRLRPENAGSYDEGPAPGLHRAVLEAIVGGVTSSAAEVLQYLRGTLLLTESPSSVTADTVRMALEYLQETELVYQRAVTAADVASSRGGGAVGMRLVATRLGQATVASGLAPAEARVVHDDLARARQSLALDTELHLVYLITPLSQLGNEPDWHQVCIMLRFHPIGLLILHQVYCMWERLKGAERTVADLVGISEAFMIGAHMRTLELSPQMELLKTRIHHRFYVAMLLHRLVQEESLERVSAATGLHKGVLQAQQHGAATFAGMVTVFCRKLGWLNLELLFSQFQVCCTSLLE